MRIKHSLLALVALFLPAVAAFATISVPLQMQSGNPSNATADSGNHAHYLIQRAQYAMDYNDTTRQPNWVAWDLTSGDVGGSGRSNFIVDTGLPAGFYQVLTSDYSGSGYDRGHMCPSADRTVSPADNQVVFTMSNMIPQTPDNNQGVWASFETYSRTVASAGNELLIISGPSGFGGSTIASGVAIPGYTWKVVIVVPLGSGTALSRITTATRVIGIKIPNIAGVRGDPYENYIVPASQIEVDTGYTFFSSLPPAVANVLRTVVDGQTSAGSPVVTSQPSSQTTVVGGTATFSVTATGDTPLTYQWVHDDVDIVGATNPTLTVSNVQAADIGSYYVVVTNGAGSTTSTVASLVVTGLAPNITTSPASQTVSAGSGVTFAVAATGSPTLTYQWRKGTSPIIGATSSTLTLSNVQAADTGSYDVVVTNSVNFATSAAAVLTVNPAAPTIATQPASRTATIGGTTSFSVAASGTAPLTYQWRKGGSPLSDGGVITGSSAATLVLTGVSAVDAASYDVVVTNSISFTTSNSATLTVNAPAPAAIVWNFTTATPSSNATTDVTASAVTQNNNNGTTALLTTTSPSGTYTGASGGNNAGAAARIGSLVKGASGSAYFEFTLTPTAGKRLVVSALSFGTRSTGTGPIAYDIYSSLDSFATPVATGAIANNSSWSLKSPAISTLTGATDTAITFRIYGYGGSGGASANTANWRIDDLSVAASTVFPPPVAPTVVSLTPANASTSVAITTPITVTFNEPVSFTGTWFSISSAANGATAATVTGGPTTFTLSPPSSFSYNDTVTVSIFGAQVVDQATAAIPGSGTTTSTFTTATYVPPAPPVVNLQPTTQTVVSGSTATFTVGATGTAPFTYLWRKGGTPIVGNASASTATLSLVGVTTADIGSYDCVVSNVAGSDLSASAALTVTVVPPTITTQPVAQSVAVGGNASFTVVASGTAPFTYLWRKGGVPIVTATTATLSFTGVTYADSGSYDVIVTNAASSATSSPASLGVTAAAPATIYWDFATAAPTSGIPANVTGGTVTQGNNNGTTALLTTTSPSGTYTGASGGNNAGAAARVGALNKAASGSAYFEFTFTPSAGRQFVATGLSLGMRSTGTGPQAYAVFTSVDNFTAPVASGTIANNSTWTLLTPSFAGVTGAPGTAVTFRLFGYNGAGTPGAGTANWRIDDVKLTAGVLALAPVPPTITTSPVAQTVNVGTTVIFTVAASGDTPLTYQWRKGGSAIVGNASATTDTLTLPTVATGAAGDYDCVVTNDAGFATSAAATLTVNKLPATVTLGNLAVAYDGTAKSPTPTTSPAALGVTYTYNGSATAPTAPGTYAVVATINDATYAGSATGTLVITTTGVVRHAPTLNGGLDGSVQVLLPENTSLATTAWVSGDLLIPGLPTVLQTGMPTYGGTLDGTGTDLTATHTVTLNGSAVLRHVVRRTDAVTIPVVSAPPAPAGTRSVSLTNNTQTPGDFATLRNLTLNGTAGLVVVPPGTYGAFSANGATGFVLGVAGATEPAVYNLQSLSLNTLAGTAQIQVVGPVILTVANTVSLLGQTGSAANPKWLTLRVSTGGVTVSGTAATPTSVHGTVIAPNGTVTLTGTSTLNGTVTSDRLTINASALLNDPSL
ncbi:MAG: immunoglobulin domain-containing protein [Verrucomicrobia bacterium]|nr:immunoglobulin domain-containing protein [Verrucomicrobiota bacterium]